MLPTQKPFENSDIGNLFLKLDGIARAFDPTIPALPANINTPVFRPFINTDLGDIQLILDDIITAIGTFVGGEAIINHITPTGGTLTITGNETVTGDLQVGGALAQTDATKSNNIAGAMNVGKDFTVNTNKFAVNSTTGDATVAARMTAQDITSNDSIHCQGLTANAIVSGSFTTGGFAGVSGSFLTADAKTVTVTNGIITAIV